MTILSVICLMAFVGYLATYALARRYLLGHHFPVPVPMPPDVGRVSVILPAYNEESGIGDSIRGALAGSRLAHDAVEVLVVEDGSTDRTPQIIDALAAELDDPRLRIVRAGERPEGEVWVGKSWPCSQGAREAKGETLVFIDADVRLFPRGLDGLLEAAKHSGAKMITAIPALECGSLAEWAIQPTIHAMIATAAWMWPADDPSNSLDIALGHIMIFQREAYERVGGFSAVRLGVGQDIQFAKLFRQHGLPRDAVLAQKVAAVRPYRSFRATWEGYTKGSTSVGLNRQVGRVIGWAGHIFLMLSLPWMLSLALLVNAPLEAPDPSWMLGAFCAWATLGLQGVFLLLARTVMVNDVPPPWYSLATGGVLWPALMIADLYKSSRGGRATWKGRSVGSR